MTKIGRPASMEHGTYGYARRLKCQCEPCMQCVRAYGKRLRHEHERGLKRRVDADRVRRHLDTLLDFGTITTIGQASNTARSVIKNILFGRNGKPPAATCEILTATRLLAVTVDQLKDRDPKVPAIGVHRRIEALHYLGHTKITIAKAVGVSDKALYLYMENDNVFQRSVDAVHAGYLKLRDTKGTSEFMRWRAYREDYLPWMCWEDETIDSLFAEPGEAACIGHECTRPTYKMSLCQNHYFVVRKDGGMQDALHFRQAVGRLSKRHIQDGARVRQEVRDLSYLGHTANTIAHRLNVSEDYVLKVREQVA